MANNFMKMFKDDTAKVLGIKYGMSKNNVPFCNVSLQGDFTDYEKNNQKATGQTCGEFYISGRTFDQTLIGKLVKLSFGVGYQGAAVIADLVPINK